MGASSVINGLELLEGTEEFQVNWDPRNVGIPSWYPPPQLQET